MPPTIFNRRRRGALAPVGSALDAIPVRSESELRAAIARVAARFLTDDNGFSRAAGGEIVIAGTFALRNTPIVIPTRAKACVVRALPGCVLLPTGSDQGVLFKVQTALVQFRDLFVQYAVNDAGALTAWFNTMVETELLGGSRPSDCVVSGCKFYGDQLFVDGTTSQSDYAVIDGNTITEANASHSACIVFKSEGQRAIKNNLSDGGGDAITVGAAGEKCMITGNDCAGGDITTTASSGSNVVSNNVGSSATTLAGTTFHATDYVGGNT
jgi:hypothetical protein